MVKIRKAMNAGIQKRAVCRSGSERDPPFQNGSSSQPCSA
jgi:hypothetical protein